MDHHVDPQIAEECTQGVVECIRQFVEVLRAEFPASLKDGPQQAPQDVLSLPPPLYSRMTERGVWEQIQTSVRRQRQQWSGRDAANEASNPSSAWSRDDQRILLLQEIILPLVQSLTACYRVLDAIPQPQTPSTPPSSVSVRKRNKPTPPRGMLSIQQYTDIACFLEFTVCTGILPLLDPNVLLSIDDRIRHHLPKSLAGRIPRACLAWGASQQLPVDGDEFLFETATAVSELIVLDRFRPMLLPRHVADLYAALFQYEHNRGTSLMKPSRDHSSLYHSLGLRKASATPNILVDATLQAKAYQTLLLRGTKTPSWLRQRVAPLLTELASTNLSAIVQVFVPLQQQNGGEVSSMASQRLGRTLATSSCGNQRTILGLGTQMRSLLEVLFTTISSGQVPVRAMAILQTIWAVLYHWPKDLVQQELFLPWQQSLLLTTRSATTTTSAMNIHKTLRQIGSLCASVPPPATEPWRVLQFFFQSSSGERPSTIMDQLLRIASMPHSLVKSIASDEARQVLHWLCRAAAASPSTATPTNHDLIPGGPASLACMWVHAMAPSEWDMTGHYYKVVVPSEDKSQVVAANPDSPSASLERVQIQTMSPAATEISNMLDDISRRARVFFETCLDGASDAEGTTQSQLQNVPSLLFRLLLNVYLSGTQSHAMTPIKMNWVHWMVAIVLLPVLCDKCSPETLLFGSGDDALGLLESIRLVLARAKARPGQNESLQGETPADANANIQEEKREEVMMMKCLDLLQWREESGSSLQAFQFDFMKLQDDKEQNETLLSIASIVLSLLIALLELGSNLRSEKEEEALQAFLPVLSSLAEFQKQGAESSSIDPGTNAGISDMAAYAMALIASRKAKPRPEAPKTPALSAMDRVQALIRDCQDDLESTQPPIRARAMVSLGRLARGYLGILKANDDEPKLVVEIDEGISQDTLIDFTVREVLRLSIRGLSDEESYVYLAAVQTIVAIGDMRPKQVLPQLGAAIVTGTMDARFQPIDLSNGQRVKLAEALVFIIRRRAAPAEYISPLVNLMVFGSTNRIGTNVGGSAKEQDRLLFADETNKYFLGVEPTESSMLPENKKEQRKEQDIRLKTGGPVFTSEEQDLVRSIRLSTLAELASVALPATVAPHCRLLVRLIVDVLRLDSSRTTCRAAALLARELYGCVLREQDDIGEATDRNVPGGPVLALATALVSLEENDLLVQTLENCAADKIMGSNDPATAARCQEALALKREVEEVLWAAQLLASQEGHKTNVPSVLTSMLQENPSLPEIDKVKALLES